MLNFILRRLAIAIPTLLIIVVVSFLIIQFAPGSPFDTGANMDPEILANIEAAYNLDKPIYVQLWIYFGNLLQGDFGPSFTYKEWSASQIIANGLPISIQLGLWAMAVGLFIGLILGTVAAINQNGIADYSTMTLSMTGIAIPAFVTAPFLALFFGIYLGWLPVSGWNDGAIQNMILPITTLALPKIGIVARIMRGSMLEVLRADHIRTARAKGLSEPVVIFRHALRTALIPVLSYLGPAIATVMVGSVVVEKFFGLPGIGLAFVEGTFNRDYPVIMGIVIVYASFIVTLNLLVDIGYGYLDPRMRGDL